MKISVWFLDIAGKIYKRFEPGCYLVNFKNSKEFYEINNIKRSPIYFDNIEDLKQHIDKLIALKSDCEFVFLREADVTIRHRSKYNVLRSDELQDLKNNGNLLPLLKNRNSNYFNCIAKLLDKDKYSNLASNMRGGV